MRFKRWKTYRAVLKGADLLVYNYKNYPKEGTPVTAEDIALIEQQLLEAKKLLRKRDMYLNRAKSLTHQVQLTMGHGLSLTSLPENSVRRLLIKLRWLVLAHVNGDKPMVGNYGFEIVGKKAKSSNNGSGKNSSDKKKQ